MTVSWICGPDQLDRAPEIPIIRTTYTWCRSFGPDRMRCDRPTGHSGRCYESIWDSSSDGTEIRFVIGVWSDHHHRNACKNPDCDELTAAGEHLA